MSGFQYDTESGLPPASEVQTRLTDAMVPYHVKHEDGHTTFTIDRADLTETHNVVHDLIALGENDPTGRFCIIHAEPTSPDA